MGKLRQRRADRLVNQDLLSVFNVIVASHHMRDRHLHIVGNDGELVGGLAIGAQDDEVLDVGAVELDRTVDRSSKRIVLRNAEADGARRLAPLAPAISSPVNLQHVRS